MVVHTLKGSEYPVQSEIHISEQEGECVIIINDCEGCNASIIFDLKQLHHFIGTLLHVQQKLKNK